VTLGDILEIAEIRSIMEKSNFRSETTSYGGYEPMSNPEVLLINNKQYLGNQGAIRLLTEKFERTESSVWNAIA
jgi:hypothetical protein